MVDSAHTTNASETNRLFHPDEPKWRAGEAELRARALVMLGRHGCEIQGLSGAECEVIEYLAWKIVTSLKDIQTVLNAEGGQ